ncbi:unnamed protein product [Macrosiphum euphorbiae]|uniref:Uncharacterized protein n=1 Tax=Macrosiphum euphorbiae TaxID=13131 RepID=A0AAV0VTV4_9HEMI|nr:unnamed protein product [Macrosiphum euphorbiae]
MDGLRGMPTVAIWEVCHFPFVEQLFSLYSAHVQCEVDLTRPILVEVVDVLVPNGFPSDCIILWESGLDFPHSDFQSARPYMGCAPYTLPRNAPW